MKDKLIGLEIKKIDNLIFRKLINYQKDKFDILLSPSQIMIIKHLYENDNEIICQKDLEHFKLRKSTLSGILDTMEKNNLIKRIDKDGRSKMIVLTNKAKELYIELQNNINEFDKLLKKNITDNELNTFYEIIDKITNNLKGEENVKIN